MRKEFNDIRSKLNKSSSFGCDALAEALSIVACVEEEYIKKSMSNTLLNTTIKDLVFAKKSVPSPLAVNSIDRAIKLLKNIEDYAWCPIEVGCNLPDEGHPVDVTIMENDLENPCRCTVRVDTAWMQNGEWVIKKDATNPRVVAWKYPSRPYIPEAVIVTKPLDKLQGGVK